ncbi:MAG: TonB-dependent receptor [Bacteroidetes bacterium]|nr:MAG: TonB-dependent receptor [Bacteroidota bacterium]
MKFSSSVFALFMCSALTAQVGTADTLSGANATDVLVTATRTEVKLGNVAVPYQIISKAQIAATGVARLQELLQEQTGLFVTNGSGTGGVGGGVFGNGVQIQGMSPDYTLILINGEPIIGRQGGTLNLARFTVANIKKIEIVKGPSSSLYGSEAMGGVINIITEQPTQNSLQAGIRAGGYGIVDANVGGNWVTRKSFVSVQANHYRFGGSDFDKNSFGFTQDPFQSNTLQVQYNQRLSPKTKLLTFFRANREITNNAFEVLGSAGRTITGDIRVNDINLNPTLVHQFSKKIQSSLRLYFTEYHSIQNLTEADKTTPYYYDNFKQRFLRIENQTNFYLSTRHTLSAGGGAVEETLITNRYAGVRGNTIGYLFAQHEYAPNKQWNVIAGVRYDRNEVYASRMSPKLAIRYQPSDRLKITASFGAGFKAPDYRQLYLSLVNAAAGGYAIYGANEIDIAKLVQLQQQGFIQTILPRAADLQLLKPETSVGINLGSQYKFSNKLQMDVNLFNNDISNQIVFDIIALRSNGSSVFSYFNVNQSFTRGIELNLHYQPTKNWHISGGYQFLQTADKAVVNAIREGRMFGRNEQTNQVYQLSRADYRGLPNRSPHMANIKIGYDNAATGWLANIRAIYRSSWGTFDKDGNGIINRTDELAQGFVQINASVGKTFHPNWQVQTGVENLLNHIDANNLPNILGRNYYVTVKYNLSIKKNNKQ